MLKRLERAGLVTRERGADNEEVTVLLIDANRDGLGARQVELGSSSEAVTEISEGLVATIRVSIPRVDTRR